MMLHKAKSKRSTMLKVLWAIPVLAACLFVQACNEKLIEPLSAQTEEFTSIKVVNLQEALANQNLKEFSMELTRDHAYKFKVSDKKTVITLLDENGKVVGTNKVKKTHQEFYYKATKTGKYTIQFSGSLDGSLDIGMARKPKKAEEGYTQEGLEEGFELIQKFDLKSGEDKEVVIDEIDNLDNLMVRIFGEDPKNCKVNFELVNADGQVKAKNFYNGRYYTELVYKHRDDRSVTLKFSAEEDATIKVGLRKQE